ncbi:MAG: extracellular solute-binding protein, partial [Planctomycetaceae bacterium]
MLSRISKAFLPRLLLLALFLAGLAGCNGSRSAPPPQAHELPFAGQQVKVLAPAGAGISEFWEAPLAEWGTQTGGSATVVEYPPDDATALTRAATSGETSVIAIVPYSLLGDAAAVLEFELVPESAWNVDSGIGWQDLLPGVREGLASCRRKPMLVPLSAPALVLYFRQDLLNQAGLKPPQTWDDYHRLLETLPDWAPGLVAVEPWSDSFCTTMFLSRAVAHAKHPDHYSVFVDLDSGTPLIDNPAFLRTLEQCRSAVEKMPDAIWMLGPLDCRRMALEGQAALAIGYEPQGEQRRQNPQSQTASRVDGIEIGVCRLPGSREIYNPTRRQWESPAVRGAAGPPLFRATLTAFDGYAACCFVKPGAKSAEARWNALSSAAGSDLAAGFPPGIAGVTRESQLTNPAEFTGPELTGTEAGDYMNALADALREPTVVHELPFPRRANFRKSLDSALVAALRNQTDPEQALGSAAGEWSRLIEEIGLDT